MQQLRHGYSPPHIVSSHLGGRVVLASGHSVYPSPRHVTQPIGDGLRIVVVLEGAMRLRAGDAPTLEIDGPTSLAICSEGEAERDQTFAEKRPFRYVLVQIDRELVRAERGMDPGDLLRSSLGGSQTAQVVFNACRSDPSASAVANQILACPETREGDLYRLSKALELTSVVLDQFDARRDAERSGRMTAAEAEQIRLVRDILCAALGEAPGMAALAAQVGMNPLKLNRGFRRLYGMTPYAFLQEERLRAAYRMLSSAGVSVGQVAFAAGYSQAHFATLFRKRFGLPPSALLPKGTANDGKATPSNDPIFSRME